MQSTYSFASWKRNLEKHENLWSYCEQAGYVNSTKLYLENGDFYQGSLNYGKRQGFGSLTETSSINGVTYVYSGDWRDDKRHGNGTLSSQSSNPLDEYVYDGEWYQGFKQGRGRLITRKDKYSGTWLHDKYH